MVIQTTKGFDKQYSKLDVRIKQQFIRRITLFRVEPFHQSLRNHGLKGKYLGYRSIDITGDVRVLYTVKNDTIIILAFIGTHSQLYG